MYMNKAMAPHSSTPAWKIPWMEEPGRLWSMGSLRVGHDWATSLSCTGEGNGNPLQCSCLENPREGGVWWAAIYGVTQSRIRLTRLSSSSSRGVMPRKMVLWFQPAGIPEMMWQGDLKLFLCAAGEDWFSSLFPSSWRFYSCGMMDGNKKEHGMFHCFTKIPFIW